MVLNQFCCKIWMHRPACMCSKPQSEPLLFFSRALPKSNHHIAYVFTHSEHCPQITDWLICDPLTRTPSVGKMVQNACPNACAALCESSRTDNMSFNQMDLWSMDETIYVGCVRLFVTISDVPEYECVIVRSKWILSARQWTKSLRPRAHRCETRQASNCTHTSHRSGRRTSRFYNSTAFRVTSSENELTDTRCTGFSSQFMQGNNVWWHPPLVTISCLWMYSSWIHAETEGIEPPTPECCQCTCPSTQAVWEDCQFVDHIVEVFIGIQHLAQ